MVVPIYLALLLLAASPVWAQHPMQFLGYVDAYFESLYATVYPELYPAGSQPPTATDYIDGSYTGLLPQSGIFLYGPWNMTAGAVLTTGLGNDTAYEPANRSTDLGQPGSAYCSANGDAAGFYDASFYTMEVVLEDGFSGLSSTIVYASK